MSHYDIFRHHLAIKYSAYGYALWDPDPGNLYPAVEIGDVGYICEGKFHRFFNVLLPAEDESHADFGVPENYERLELNPTKHISIGKLSPNNFCSAKVTSIPESERLAQGPDEIRKVSFSCPRKEGAVLYLPIEATGENTVKRADFGKWIVKHIDCWFAWARQHGWGIDRMEDIILVTGTHRTRSWTNVAFPGGQEDSRALFGAKADHRDGIVTINWQFSHESSRGVVLNCGPDGENLPEDQCIFIRGAAGPNPDPKGYDEEPDLELIPIPPVSEDPLHILLEYIAEEAPPNCEMVLVHDDDLAQFDLDGIYDSTASLIDIPQYVVLTYIRSLKPRVHSAQIDLSDSHNSASVGTESAWVATLSNVFENQHPLSTSSTSQSLHVKTPFPPSEHSCPSHANLGRDFLECSASPANFSEPNVPASEDSLPRYMSDSMSTLQLGSIKQPELDTLHPLALLYGSGGLSYESISSYESEMSYLRTYPDNKLSLNKNASPNLPSPSPGAGTGNSRFFNTSIGSSSTVLEPSRTTQPHTRVFSRGTSSSYPGETSVVILRIQVFSCQDLEAKDSSGYSNPYVVVSGLGKRFQTPVCERDLNPVYEPNDATFDFPIYKSLLQKSGTLKFVVWSKGKFRDDYLGEFALPVDKWFKGTALAFNDPNNRPFFVNLASSRRTITVRGAVHIKSGFVQPPDSRDLLDFGQIYNALILAPPVGAIILEICGAKDLPKWPNLVRTGWDMDPFVEVSIGNRPVGTTPVIQHSRNPVWEERMCFPLHIHDLSLPIQLTVIDRNMLSKNDYVGVASIDIAQLIEMAPKKDPKTELYPNMVTMHEFERALIPIRYPTKVYTPTPTITYRACYQPYDALLQQARQEE